MSCSPKDFPTGKPFVIKSGVSLKAPVANEQRKAMELELGNYLDDSLKVQTKAVLGFKRQLNPPIFDSANIDRSKAFMKNYLNSLGFYAATFYNVTIKFDSSKPGQIRTDIKFFIDAGKQIKFDSIWYDLKVTELETLANESKDKALMKKGEGYSKQVVGQELDRLVSLYRTKGYFKMARASLVAEFDSLSDILNSNLGVSIDPSNGNLVNLDIDPFAQIQKLQKRRENPTVDFRILQRPGADTTAFLKYNLGKLTIFPEAKIDEDKSQLIADSSLLSFYTFGGVTLRYKQGLFNNKTVRRFNTMVPGMLYNEEQYFKTVNAFGQAGSWQQVDVKAYTHIDSTDTIPKVDINLFLTPAKKYSFKTDFETSLNIGRNAVDVFTGSFLGLSVVGNLLNRNFGKSAIQQNTNLRGGVELSTKNAGSGNRIFQSILFSAGTTFSIPRLWPPLKWLVKKPDASRTFLNIGGGYNDRQKFYTLANLNIALGFEWKKRNHVWTIKIPNVELVKLDRSDSLEKLIAQNPNLSYSFNQGLVLGLSGSWQWNISYRKKPNQNTYVRVNAEESGLLTGSLFNNTLRFWKADLDVRHNIVFAKHKWAFRATGGYGKNFGLSTAALPFFRQFIAGGPNSMRAWRLRQLGLGNSYIQDTARFKDRLGDIYMELNAEYRFNITKLFGYPIEGALFTDIGNVWNRFSQNPLRPNEGVFAFKNLGRDLAVAAGFGIRWDFSYLRVRLDYAYKIKDPVRGGNGWLKKFEHKTPNSIGYQENKNYAIQFGVDYPF